MLYPNFSRRTLALILSCLVITLGGVGLLFLVYIFNETSSLLSNSLEKINHSYQPYKQNVIKDDEHGFDKRLRNQSTQGFDGSIKRSNLHKSTSSYFLKPINTRVLLPPISNRVKNRSKILPIIVSTKEAITTEVHQDTIYIDDFDRPIYKQKDTNDIDNINYFDVILVDHKEGKKGTVPDHSQKQGIISKTINNDINNRIISKENGITNDVFIDSKPNVLRTPKYTRDNSIGNSILLDADSIGSGSGDFTDDTEESNEIKVRKSYDYVNINKKFTQRKEIKKQRRRKQRYQFFENYKSSSFLKRLATKPHIVNNNYVNGVVNGKVSANFSSHKISKEADIVSKDVEVPSSGYLSHDIIHYDNHKNLSTFKYNNNLLDHVRPAEISSTVNEQAENILVGNQRGNDAVENDESWIEPRTRRIMGNVKKSEERSRQLLLCEEAGGGELCRMLFKEHVNKK